jgi:hypothetical protein
MADKSGFAKRGLCAPALGLLVFAVLILPATARAQDDRPVATGTLPADWPEGMSALVAIPCPADEHQMPAPTIRLKIPGRQNLVAPGQFEAADKLAGTPDRIWVQLKLEKEYLGKPVEVQFSAYPPKKGTPYQSKRDGEQLVITTADNKPLLSYWYGKPAPNQKYPLTDYIHPLIGLDGETLTDCGPKDHLHHRGIFWTWVRHQKEGKSLGSWWIPDTIHLEERDLKFLDGPVFSRFAAHHEWIYQAKGSKDTLPFVDEYLVCRVFETTPEGRAMDVDIALTALVDGIRFGGTTELDKGYGGLSFRYAPAAEAKIVADGKPIPKDLNHLRARWADWTGRFKDADGKASEERSGAALFVATDHPDSPPEWITRLYGVLNVAYPGLKMIDLPKGQTLRLHYRVWVHRGDSAAGHVDEHYRAYAGDWKWVVAKASAAEADKAK